MLKFSTIRYKNFLSTGNAWTTHTLDQHHTTLIIGANGTGKTTLLDALCFVLFGKTYRKIKRATVVNCVNEKEMVVELEFSTPNNSYMIRRGMNPAVFDVVCDGTPIPAMASTAEMQEYLEKYVLQCNYKAFCQVVILGAASYVPFMRLTPAERREILEDILDIEVFSTMATLNKEVLGQVKSQLQEARSELALVESRHAMAQTYAAQWDEQQQARRAEVEQALQTCEERIAAVTAARAEVVPEEEQWHTYVKKLPTWQSKLTKATKLVARFSTERQHLNANRTFFVEHDQCTMCQQPIDATFKASKMDTLDASLATVEADRAAAMALVDKFTKLVDAANDAQQHLRAVEDRRRGLDEQLRDLQREQTRLQREHEATFQPAPPPPTELGDMDATTSAVSALVFQKDVREAVYDVLKDTGIRTRVIQQYLPVVNGLVNQYLEAMGFPILFTLDEQFNETIKSRHRSKFSYENFSEGEKRRIDLALVMTWRAVARMKNSIYTNLIVFDEILDSSMDHTGIDDFLQLIQTEGPDSNVVVISHRDAMIDKFAHTIVMAKDRGFSTIKSAG